MVQVNKRISLGFLGAVFSVAVSISTAPAAPMNSQRIGAIGKLPIGDARTLATASLGIDVAQGPYSSVTVNEPQQIRVNLSTTVPGADGLVWRLVELGGDGVLVAFGAYPRRTKLQFQLDLSKYLQARPPRGGTTYFLTAQAIDVSRPGARSPLGHWSEPLVIHYRHNAAAPTHFEETARYRRMRVVFDDIDLVKEQAGDGTEEFLTQGLVQTYHLNRPDPEAQPVKGQPESFIGAVGHGRFFGPVRRNLEPPTDSKSFNIDYTKLPPQPNKEALVEVDFGNTGAFNPRRVLIATTVLERDGGGEVQGWVDAFREAGEEMREKSIVQLDKAEFNAQLQKYGDEMTRDMFALLGDAVLSPSDADPTTMFVKVGVVAATIGIKAAIEAEKDDYYGLRAMPLDVMSNRIDLVHSMPGKLIQTADGPVYRLEKFEWPFYGPPQPTGAAPWDGKIEVDFHIEFYDRVN